MSPTQYKSRAARGSARRGRGTRAQKSRLQTSRLSWDNTAAASPDDSVPQPDADTSDRSSPTPGVQANLDPLRAEDSHEHPSPHDLHDSSAQEVPSPRVSHPASNVAPVSYRGPARRHATRGSYRARYNNNRRPRDANGFYQQGNLVIPPGMKDARGVVLYLEDVPKEATTWDIWSSFNKYGTIVFIDLDEVPESDWGRGARFRFEPPPADTSFIINGRCQILLTEGDKLRAHWTYVYFGQLGRNEATIETPLHNRCAAAKRMTPSSISFGIFTGPTTVMSKRSLSGHSGEREIKLTFDFKRRIVHLLFVIEPGSLAGPEESTFRVDIKFDRLSSSRNLFRVDLGPNKWALVVNLEDPPLVYKRMASMSSAFWGGLMNWSEKDAWLRATEISPDPMTVKQTEVSLDHEHQGIDIGCWRTYWIEMDDAARLDWLEVETSLQDWNIKTISHLPLQLVNGESVRPKLWELLEGPEKDPVESDSKSSWSADLALLNSPLVDSYVRLPFEVRYQLEVCLSRQIFCEYNITREFLEKLAELSDSSSRVDNDRGRLMLEYAADQGIKIWNPMDLFQDPSAKTYFPANYQIPEYCAMVRRVTITPTTMFFSTPLVETSNRVIRHFSQVQANFLRVQFTDELPEGRVNGSDVERDNEIYARCYHVLREGIRMGPWHWEFLAFGNSQIRENGVYFYCKPQTAGSPTCDSIRSWMGRFSHITVIAKYAARLGQCFSTTRLIRGITAPAPVKIKDVERNDFCFTDGVGKISPFLATMVADDWRLNETPSAFQFRMGGCKGVLVTWADTKGFDVHIRKSQEKFEAEFNGLEIIRCSQFSVATLNRQTITILSTLGVPDQVFIDMMDAQLHNYNAAMTDKAIAVRLLKTYIDENDMTSTIAQMILDGFMDTNEPFVQTLLHLWRSWSVKALKEKARLVVEEGAFLLGCVDETGTLRGYSISTEGHPRIKQHQLPQIFLQVPNRGENASGYRVITGLCLVGRNPSLHPGDIRVVEAVDVPALRHIRNAVVFPLTGDRDVPSMLSGGDLDGDDFFVIWDQKLLPPRRNWAISPMSYTAPKAVEEPSGVTGDNLKAFFVLHMKNNQLPLIAHAHLATADLEDEGAQHRNCLVLAELHSQAVDYVKTGVPAVFDRRKLSPRSWPHFMEKAPNKTYRSMKALGQLFDMASTQKFRFQANYESPFDSRILQHYNVAPAMLMAARRIKTLYDRAMRRIMGQLEIQTEFEVWSTFVLRRPRFSSDYKMQERLGHESFTLKQIHRDMCRKEVGGSRDIESFGPFVAAMYQVTWEEVRIALYEARQEHVRPDGTVGRRRINPASMPLISFPWLFDDILGKIARGVENHSGLEELGVNVQSQPTKPPPSPVPNDEAGHDLTKPDYMRTADGLIIHRGEVLNLFGHESDDEHNYEAEVVYDPPAGGEKADEAWVASGESTAADTVDRANGEEPKASPTLSSPPQTVIDVHLGSQDDATDHGDKLVDALPSTAPLIQEVLIPNTPPPRSGDHVMYATELAKELAILSAAPAIEGPYPDAEGTDIDSQDGESIAAEEIVLEEAGDEHEDETALEKMERLFGAM